MAGEKVAEQLRKITIATCGAKPTMELLAKLEKKGKDGKADLLDVFGIAAKFKPGTSDKGDYIRFVGQFKAKNLVTGETYMSAAAIFPKMIEESLWGVMGGENVNSVQLAFRIGVRYDEQAATKYTYYATPIMKPSESDPLSMLEKQLGDEIKALPLLKG